LQWPLFPRPMFERGARPRSYGKPLWLVNIRGVATPVTIICAAALWCGRSYRDTALGIMSLVAALTMAPAGAAEVPLHVVALGDSLVAGYGLRANEAFPSVLQRVLVAKGIAVEVANAGVSGETASDGLARLDWSVPQGTDAVIIELGANDMLRGIATQVTRDALDTIVRRLRERHIAMLLCGMRAAPNLGPDYGRSFDEIYPALAAKYDVSLYPFFLAGVAGDLGRLQPDGLHPTAAGVDLIVRGILSKVDELIARVRAQHPS
jgi:acyl-CoA thioesterase I